MCQFVIPKGNTFICFFDGLLYHLCSTTKTRQDCNYLFSISIYYDLTSKFGEIIEDRQNILGTLQPERHCILEFPVCRCTDCLYTMFHMSARRMDVHATCQPTLKSCNIKFHYTFLSQTIRRNKYGFHF